MRFSYGKVFVVGLMALLGLTVVVDVSNVVLAVQTRDGLVADRTDDEVLPVDGPHYTTPAPMPSGWHVKLQPPERSGYGAFEVTVSDGRDRPVEDLKVTLELVRPTISGLDRTVRMAAIAPGRYRGLGEVPAWGVWDATVEIQHGDEVYGHRERLRLSEGGR